MSDRGAGPAMNLNLRLRGALSGVAAAGAPPSLWLAALPSGAAVAAACEVPFAGAAGRDFAYVTAGAAGVVFVFAAGRLGRPARSAAWALLGAGMISMTLGEIARFWRAPLAAAPPATGLADLLFVAGYALLIAGALPVILGAGAGRIVRSETAARETAAGKQARDAIERFRIGFEHGAVGQSLTSLDGRFIQVNDAMARLLGYSKTELSGMPFDDLTHPDDRVVSAATVDALISYRGARRFEKRYITKGGATVWADVNVALVCDERGEPDYFVGSFVDITERKRAEEALKETSDRLTLAARAGGVGIWDYDPLHKRLTWDDQMLRLYGITRDQFEGVYEAWQSRIHAEDRDRNDDEMQVALREARRISTPSSAWSGRTGRSVTSEPWPSYSSTRRGNPTT